MCRSEVLGIEGWRLEVEGLDEVIQAEQQGADIAVPSPVRLVIRPYLMH